MNDYQTKIQTLQAHGIDFKVEEGKLYADYCIPLYGMFHHEWEDISDFTTEQLMEWLKH